MGRILLLVIIMTSLLLIKNPIINRVSAESPSFVRQETTDGADDFSEGYEPVVGYNNSDIRAVSYFSDGKFLNATIWLSSLFEERPLKYDPTYAIIIDADSDFNTGSGGFEYDAQIRWNNNTGTWMYLVEDRSVFGDTDILNGTLITNYTGFFDRGASHVNIFLDLSRINYPDQYRIEFVVGYFGLQDENKMFHAIEDYSDLIPIPPAKFTLSTSPNSISMRSEEEKRVELRINASSNTLLGSSNISLSAEPPVEGLKLTFEPNKTSLGSNGISVLQLHIKVPKVNTTETYVVPLSAIVSIPAENVFSGTTKKAISFEKQINYNLAIAVLPPFSAKENLDNFVLWLSPINSVWTFLVAIGAVITPLVIRVYNKKRAKRR